jgi:hypothetical protein
MNGRDRHVLICHILNAFTTQINGFPAMIHISHTIRIGGHMIALLYENVAIGHSDTGKNNTSENLEKHW